MREPWQLQESLASPGRFEPASRPPPLCAGAVRRDRRHAGARARGNHGARGTGHFSAGGTAHRDRRVSKKNPPLGYFPAVLADLTARAQSGGVIAFDSRRIYDGEYLCVMRQGHPLANAPLTLDQFCAARHMLVSFPGRRLASSTKPWRRWGGATWYSPSTSSSPLGRVVANSDMLTVLPRLYCRHRHSGHPGAAPPAAECASGAYYALWRRRAPSKRPSTGCCWHWPTPPCALSPIGGQPVVDCLPHEDPAAVRPAP